MIEFAAWARESIGEESRSTCEEIGLNLSTAGVSPP